MWGKLWKGKDKAQALKIGKEKEWLKSFEKETKDYYLENPEKVSEFLENSGKNNNKDI